MDELTIVPPALTKASIQEAGKRYAQILLDDGESDILTAYIRLRALKAAVDSALTEIVSQAMDEADRYSRDDRMLLGVKFRNQGGWEQYDFSHDSAWQECKKTEVTAAEARKKREAFLKALREEMIDPKTGEIVSPAVVTGYTSSTLALTFPER